MNENFMNVEVMGNKLSITRDALMLRLETCISLQKECKEKNDFTTWMITAGYIEAIKDLLSHFEAQNIPNI